MLPVDEGVQHLEYIPVDGNLTSVPARFGLHLGRVLYDGGVRVRMSPSLAELVPEPAIYLNASEIEALGVAPGDLLLVEGNGGSVELPVAVDNTLGQGTVYVPANLAATAPLGSSVAVAISRGGES